jgi:hypothetical protein
MTKCRYCGWYGGEHHGNCPDRPDADPYEEEQEDDDEGEED